MKKLKLELNEHQLKAMYHSLQISQADLHGKIQGLLDIIESNKSLMQQIEANIPELKEKGSILPGTFVKPSPSQLPMNKKIEKNTPGVVNKPDTSKGKSDVEGKAIRTTFNWKGKIIQALASNLNSEMLVSQITDYILENYTDVQEAGIDRAQLARNCATYCHKMSTMTQEIVMRKSDGRSFYSLNPNHPTNSEYFPEEEEKENDEPEEEIEEDDEEVENENSKEDFEDEEDDLDKRISDDIHELSEEELEELNAQMGFEDDEDDTPPSRIQNRIYDDISEDPEWIDRMRSQGFRVNRSKSVDE